MTKGGLREYEVSRLLFGPLFDHFSIHIHNASESRLFSVLELDYMRVTANGNSKFVRLPSA